MGLEEAGAVAMLGLRDWGVNGKSTAHLPTPVFQCQIIGSPKDP
jgi:hypothetical protein